jgi:hypothetical protein
MKERGQGGERKVNLTLSHVTQTFFMLDTRIGPQAFSHNSCTIRQNVFF